MVAENARAEGPSFQTAPAATSTGRRNKAPSGSVTASASARAVTSVDSATGRASRNSFSGDPARTASLLAAFAATPAAASVPITIASAAA